jgi:hypothetical protein
MAEIIYLTADLFPTPKLSYLPSTMASSTDTGYSRPCGLMIGTSFASLITSHAFTALLEPRPEGKPNGTGKPSQLTRKLIAAYRKFVHKVTVSRTITSGYID